MMTEENISNYHVEKKISKRLCSGCVKITRLDKMIFFKEGECDKCKKTCFVTEGKLGDEE
jgi:hypothetical protein